MAASNGEETVPATTPHGRGWPYWSVVTVAVVGLLVTVGLIVVSTILYHNNENRLLKLRTRDIGSVLTAALPSLQTSVASTATFAEATNGNAGKFDDFAQQFAGQGGGRPFASMSLWRVDHPERGPTTVVGAQPELAASMGKAPALFARAAATHKLTVLGLLGGPAPRIGYAYVEPGTNEPLRGLCRERAAGQTLLGPTERFLVQRHQLCALPRQDPDRGHAADHKRAARASARASGGVHDPVRRHLPDGAGDPPVIARRIASARPAVGDRDRGRAVDGRGSGADGPTDPAAAPHASSVADENRRLYAEQRGIAQTLQQALLPTELPQLHGLQASARYEAGAEGVDIGGDWYDAIAVDDKRLLLVVGDVSGRGLRAATTMAELRYGIHAYAAQGDQPATILTKLNALVSVKSSGQLATVLCVMVDPDARELTLTSAGHLPPLLISNGRGEFVKTDVGLPIGVDRNAAYTSVTVSVAPGATLLAFTDGLVERRGESIDVGLGRLREHATSNHATLDELLTRVVSNLRHDGPEDDTAIAGIRWLS